jgi:hypothetical protein
MVDATLQFLWNRRTAGRPDNEASRWAIDLLEQGHQTIAILRLAGGADLDQEVTEQLVRQAVRDLGRPNLLDDSLLLNAYEQASVADYFAGRIDGWTLIERGCDFYYESGEHPARVFWIRIASDAAQHGGQGVCGEFAFDRRPFDEVLQEALLGLGFARSLPGSPSVSS